MEKWTWGPGTVLTFEDDWVKLVCKPLRLRWGVPYFQPVGRTSAIFFFTKVSYTGVCVGATRYQLFLFFC